MNIFQYVSLFIFMIPLIAVLDYIIFVEIGGGKCSKCGNKPKWWTFLVATMVEIFCFAVGIIMGIGAK